MKKVGFMVDSSYGLTEKEARARGFYFVPIIIEWNGEVKKSGVDIDLDFVYDNLDKDTTVKTAACTFGDIEAEYERALKEVEKLIYVPISKHLSSTVSTAQLVANEVQFEGRVTVYDSEFIAPWIMQFDDVLTGMVKHDASYEEYMELLDLQKGHMLGWLFPKNLDRVYAGGRLSKTAYIAGTMLKVTPVVPVIDGRLDTNVIKTRSPEKALVKVKELVIESWNDKLERGFKPKLITVLTGRDDSEVKKLEQMFIDEGFEKPVRLWLPVSIVGHVGVGALGAGCGIEVPEKFAKYRN